MDLPLVAPCTTTMTRGRGCRASTRRNRFRGMTTSSCRTCRGATATSLRAEEICRGARIQRTEWGVLRHRSSKATSIPSHAVTTAGHTAVFHSAAGPRSTRMLVTTGTVRRRRKATMTEVIPEEATTAASGSSTGMRTTEVA